MAEALAGFGREVLFHQGEPGGLTYRIPALLYVPPESAFLAFAEQRSSPRDEDAQLLVMRRGQKEGASVQWGPPEPLTAATLPGHRTMNPCPLFERRTHAVFLFFICVRSGVSEQHQIRTGKNAARLCFVLSRDGGRTWSPATDLTETATAGSLGRWATLAVGPGHGLQLSSGRLVVPAYAYYVRRRCAGWPVGHWTRPHSFALYSDDGGQSWAPGRLLQALRCSECQVAELRGPNGRPLLYCNARGTEGHRAEAFSIDLGGNFDEAFLSAELGEPPGGCQGSVVSFVPTPSSLARPGPAGPWLAFSHPTSHRQRKDLGVYVNTSPLERGSWATPRVLNQGPSGYSDLAVCAEGGSLLFGCLFECGVAESYEEITFLLFSEAELLGQGPSAGQTESQFRPNPDSPLKCKVL